MATTAPLADTAERIRRSAIRLFGEAGFEASSVRRIARDAGVSPGLVQHHFPTKRALRDAADGHVLSRVAEAIETAAAEAAPHDRADAFGLRTIALMRAEPELVAYVRRVLIEDDPAGRRLFDGLVALARAQTDELRQAGALRAGVDETWAALHVVLADLVVVLLAPAIDRHLDTPVLSPEGLERWQRTTRTLFTEGLFPEEAHDG